MSASVDAPPDLSNQLAHLTWLYSQASELDEMNRAFRVRTLEKKMHETESSIKLLCQRTANDGSYREENEPRMTEVFRELLAIKQQISQVNHRPAVSWEDIRTYVAKLLAPLGVELGEDVAIVQEAEKISAGLPSPQEIAEIKKQNAHLLERNSQLRGQISRHFPRRDSQQSSSSESDIDPDIRRRINEAIGSTRRWNAQYSSTKLEESIFVKNFLEKQGSRDMPMAQLIHRALGRLLSQRGMTPSSCRSLGEFCEMLAWKDVTYVIKKLFGPQKADTVRKLAKGKQK